MKPRFKNILILTGDAGAGHIACSNALKAAFKENDPSLEVEIIDIFQFSPFSKKYDAILSIVSRSFIAKFIFDSIFKLIDKYEKGSKIAFPIVLKRIYKPTLELIKQRKPDLVVVNNPLAVEVVSKCREECKFNYIVTVTDIATVIRWWASPNADLIFSPSKESTERILNVSPDSNIVTGYYSLRKVNRLTLQERMMYRERFCKLSSFNISKPIILITGCGISTIKILKKIKGFVKKSNYQFIILTGRDTVLETSLKDEFCNDKRIFIQGYTDKILTYFSIVDLIIAKPGASTTLEIEKVGQRAIFTETVGYQEVGNVEYLLNNPNFLYVDSNYGQVPQKVEELLKKEKIAYYGEMKDARAIVEYICTQMQL